VHEELAEQNAVLVTNKHRLRNFATRHGLEVWSSDEFIAYVRSVGHN